MDHHIEVSRVILSYLEITCDATKEEKRPHSVIPTTITMFRLHFLGLGIDKASKEKKVKTTNDFSFQPVIVTSPGA